MSSNLATGSMTVDTTGEWLAAQSVCRIINVAEDAQSGTSDWFIQAPDITSPKVRVPAGQLRSFTTDSIFVPGQRVALLSAATGSMKFTWEEIR